jgi:hypothetical protein
MLAWRRLSTAQQQKAVGMLKAAFEGPNAVPRFRADLTAGMPEGLSPAKQDLYIFARAAVWPDVIRDQAHPANAMYHRGPWHYYDYPYVAPGDPMPLPAEPPITPAGKEPGDLLSALDYCIKDVKAPGAAVGGDLHQPLHCTQMFSRRGLEKGDQGGNLQLVRRYGPNQDKVVTLHSVWDDLLGYGQNFDKLEELATALERHPKYQDDGLAASLAKKSHAAWVREGADLAATAVYLEGQLDTYRGKNARDFLADGNKASKVPRVPSDYERNSRAVAEQRLALAGRRMALLLLEAGL